MPSSSVWPHSPSFPGQWLLPDQSLESGGIEVEEEKEEKRREGGGGREKEDTKNSTCMTSAYKRGGVQYTTPYYSKVRSIPSYS